MSSPGGRFSYGNQVVTRLNRPPHVVWQILGRKRLTIRLSEGQASCFGVRAASEDQSGKFPDASVYRKTITLKGNLFLRYGRVQGIRKRKIERLGGFGQLKTAAGFPGQSLQERNVCQLRQPDGMDSGALGFEGRQQGFKDAPLFFTTGSL